MNVIGQIVVHLFRFIDNHHVGVAPLLFFLGPTIDRNAAAISRKIVRQIKTHRITQTPTKHRTAAAPRTIRSVSNIA
jgi:hypothetical protein